MYAIGPYNMEQRGGITFASPPAGHVGASLKLCPESSVKIWQPDLPIAPCGLFWIPTRQRQHEHQDLC